MTSPPPGDGSRHPLRDYIAEELRALMARRRMSGVDLARSIERSHTYVWRRLNAETAFDTDDLEAIAEALDVHVCELFPPDERRPPGRFRDVSSRDDVVRPIGSGRPLGKPLNARVDMAL